MSPALLYASAALALLAAGPARASPAGTSRAEAAAGAVTPVATPGLPASFADLVERVAPAVVSVEITSRVPVSELTQGAGDPFAPQAAPASPEEPTAKAQALCSGFFITASGYLVTNNHCVRDQTSLKVTLKDGRELTGRLVGADEPTDLAVIKVEGDSLPFISFADKGRPRVGDWAIAIGNPYGLSGTATAGIVSANAREIGSSFNDFIQVDTPINRGNSGGPTFDTAGRVIGVNTIIFSEGGGSSGIGFAIPADTVEAVTRQLIAQGRVSRGYLGATIQTLTPEMAESVGLAGRKGAVVAEVAPVGPAERAGLKTGDVLVAFNGRPLASSTDLTRHVAATVAGQSFELGLYRGGRPLSVRIAAGLRPSEQQLARGDSPAGQDGEGGPAARHDAPVLGLTLGALDARTRRLYGLDETGGALVERVAPDSEAAGKGVQQGMVVVRAGDRPVHAPADIQGALDEARRQGRTALLLGVRTGGHTAFLTLKLKDAPAAGEG